MGKKHKATKLENNAGSSVRMKRKISESTDESPTRKRAKDDSWFPGKFVLLNPKKNLNQQQNGKHQSESSTSTPEKPKKLNKKKKTKKKKFESSRRNQNAMNNEDSASSENSQKDDASILESFYNGELDSDSENYSEDDFESLSEEEECQEEWDTDTDYDGEEEEYDSMDYEDDCNEYYTDDEAEDAPYNSGDDSDYVPDIEDKFIKKGEAIFHDGKGLDLAFGDSTESKIIEIKDIHPALDDSMDNEDVPKLVTLNGDQEADDEDEDMGEETEKLIKELQIDDDEDDEKIIESSKLLKNATFFNCINEQGVFVILRETIHFHGILNIKSILNNVEINGYELTEGSELSSAISISHSSYFVNLSPVINTTSSKTIKTLKDELANYLTKDDIEDLIIKINLQSDVLLHLSEGFINTQMQMLMYYSPYTLLPSKKFILSNNICQSSELLLSSRFFVSDENRKLSAFAVSSQWNNLEMSSTSRFFIVGGKNVGKSTLSQFLINKNVTKFQKILLIDLDIGQPICQATQTVSATLISKPLIGSGFLNAITPSKSILYGDKNVMISPFKYVRCVRKLVDFCNTNRELKNIPWIINTMGYQKGFGLQLISLLIRIIQPTDVIQIQHGIQSYNFSKVVTDSVVNEMKFSFFNENDYIGIDENFKVSYTTHVIDSIVNNQSNDFNRKWTSNASEIRKMSMLAQLGKLVKGNQTTLNDVIPFKASTDKIQMVVIEEEFSNGEMQGFNLDLLNANIVYLCNSNNFNTEEQIFDCYGVGIVRGIDKINQQIYLLLPHYEDEKDQNILQSKINVLAICNIPLPSEIILKQGNNVNGKLPHVTCYREKIQSGIKYFNKRQFKDCF